MLCKVIISSLPPGTLQSRQAVRRNSQLQPAATISGHLLQHFSPLHHQPWAHFSTSSALWGEREQQGSWKRTSSILIPITCHYVTQVMHLRWPGGIFFCFKYPQWKLLKTSLGPPEAGCIGHLWPRKVSWLIRQHLCGAVEFPMPEAGKKKKKQNLKWDLTVTSSGTINTRRKMLGNSWLWCVYSRCWCKQCSRGAPGVKWEMTDEKEKVVVWEEEVIAVMLTENTGRKK